MASIEILLLNYFSVLFLTIAFGIYIKKPEKTVKSFSLWYWLSQVILALVLYKVIQLYDGFKIIYAVDLLFVALFALSSITLKSSKTNKIEQLAKTIPRLHKLSTDEFSSYLTTLFKAYGFQSVKQVKIQNDDPSNTYDYYLLARHEGSLVEIRIVNQTKVLTEAHINQVASSFRDSTSQATSWLLATSAKTDKNTNIFIRNSGADIKVFDLKAISDLVYVLAPNFKPNSGIIKNTSISLIDFLLNVLSRAKDKLILEHPHPDQSSDFKASQQFLSEVLNESESEKPSNMELFDNVEPDIDADPLTSKEEPKTKRKKKKKESSESDVQGDLKLADNNHEIKEPKPIDTPPLISSVEIVSIDSESTSTNSIKHENKDIETDESLDTESIELNGTSNEVIDETITVEEDADPLFDLDSIHNENKNVIQDDTEFGEFPTASDETTNSNQNSILDLDNLSSDMSQINETNLKDTNSSTDIEIQAELSVDESMTVEIELDPLENLDGVLDVHSVVDEINPLDDFPELSTTDIINVGNDDNFDLFAVDGEALNLQENDPLNEVDKGAVDLLSEIECTPSMPVTDSIDQTVNSVDVDLLAIESSDILETTTNLKIDLSDLGAALPHEAPNTRKNRDTLP